ncbi:MAG TPA: hypothetical protein VGZ25_03765 [Gemmataceae bacterium]|nr:hypothetical protein [Gemmataceae bacterium]
MGTMIFQVPQGLTAEAVRELAHACVAGGPDNMPWPTDVHLDNGRLVVRRNVDESGYLLACWEIENAGLLMGATATLMERADPYWLPVELARGKVNQIRGQEADWRAGGLQVPGDLSGIIHQCSISFGQAATSNAFEEAARQAQASLKHAYNASDELVRLYTDQVFQIRHQRQTRLDTLLGCRLTRPPQASPEEFSSSFNSACLAVPWSDLEPESGNFRWEILDDLVQWSEGHQLSTTIGPLIDFSASRLPSWLWLYERDLASLAGFMCTFVESAIRRYRGRVRSWHLTSASNCSTLLSLGEDELLWLTVRMAETARQVDPGLELVLGIAQPWGEYMALEDRTHSPFMFADTLVRSGLNLAALDVEVIMGVTPRGSYCRDVLELSRLIDLYALLGIPLRLTMGYPASQVRDSLADPELRVGAGKWKGGFNPDTQESWAKSFGSLALCKPSVQAVHWIHASDAEPHLFPNCGLFDAEGKARSSVASLHRLREEHLR